MMRISYIIILMLLFASNAVAFEPPQYSLADAVDRAESIFIGRVIKIEENEVGEYSVKATATIKVLNCIVNVDCDEFKEIKIVYYSQTHADRAFPVNFPISTNILFPLRKRIRSNILFFDSDWNDGIDIAYIIGDSEFTLSYKETSNFALYNIFLPSIKEESSMREINTFIQIKTQ